MSDDREVIPPAPGGVAPDAADLGEIAKKQWSEALQAFGKTTTAMTAGTPFMPGGVPFTMPFPPGATTADANNRGEEGATNTATKTAPLPPAAPTTLKRRPSRAASLPQKKAKPAEQPLGVRSQSQAALALLATAAGGVFPSSSDLQEPPASLKTDDTLPAPAQPSQPQPQPTSQGDDAGKNASVNPPTRKMSLDLSLDIGEDEDLALMNTEHMDERELKKLRRKQSNRESARRSRLKKQEECDTLQRENRSLRDEIQQLKNEKIELAAQVAILNAKLSMAGVLGAMQQQQQQQQPSAAAALPPPVLKPVIAATHPQAPLPAHQPAPQEEEEDAEKTES